jgi:Slime mold cyclic AMP receptor
MNLEEFRSIYIGTSICSGISFITSCIIIYLYLANPSLRTFSFKMICNLVSYDILHCIAFSIPTYGLSPNDFLCKSQSILINISSMLCTVWAFIIGLHLYLSTLGRKTEGFMKRYLISTWTISLSFGLAPSIGGSYGNNFGWCWVESKSLIYEYILFYIPLWLVITANCYFYIQIISKTKKSIQNIEDSKDIRDSLSKLKYYPLVSLCCYIPITINRILENFYDPNFYFTILGIMSVCSQGLLNSIVYGLNRRTKRALIGKSSMVKDTISNLSESFYN